MILGAMQPYFFPYLGHFELIAVTTHWVVVDVVQYNKKSWMNRNRILHPHGGWQYISLPVRKTPQGALVRDVHAVDPEGSMRQIIRQIDHYRRAAPYFQPVVDLISAAFANAKTDRLVDINVSTLVETCRYLNLDLNWSLCSELELDISSIEHAGQWALRTAQKLGAQEYVNPPGGRSLFRPDEWRQAGIGLSFTRFTPYVYACPPFEQVEHLSILDVLMWNHPDAVRNELLRRRSLGRDAPIES